MSAKEIIFGGQALHLLPSGCIFWPSQNMLIVSDLHLEKGSSFIRRGRFLPPHDSCETLDRLDKVIAQTQPKKIMLLGDSFHDEAAYQRLDKNCLSRFASLCATYDIIWIEGNHERGFVPPCVSAYAELTLDGLTFRHEADADFSGPEISGHYHPGALVAHKGSAIRQKCFIGNDTRLIMPAFGAYTGNLDITDPVYGRFFGKSFTAHLLGQKRIYSLSSGTWFKDA